MRRIRPASPDPPARTPRAASSLQFAEQKRPFWPLFQDPKAFFELFSLAFLHLDREWDAQGATYMEFQKVIAATEAAVQRWLQQAPETVEQLQGVATAVSA